MTRKITITEDTDSDVIDVTVPTTTSVVSVDAQRGPKGDKGDTGDTGPQGPPGESQTPASTVTDETTFGITPAVGTSTNYARADHTHGSQPREVPDPATLTADDLLTVSSGAYVGTDEITVDQINFDLTAAQTLTTAGQMTWDADVDTIDVVLRNGTATPTLMHVGQDEYFYVKVSATITRGQVVHYTGTDGGSGHVLAAPFLADGTYDSKTVIGVATQDAAVGEFVHVLWRGKLRKFDTSLLTPGILYASTTVAGGYQSTAPTAPNNIVTVAVAIDQKNNGNLLVRPTFANSLAESEDVFAPSPTTGQVLAYNGLTSRYELTTLTASDVGADPTGSASAVQSNLTTHEGLTTSAHGGIVPSTRQVNTSGTGLSGGGDLSADRTITLDPTALAADSAFTTAFAPFTPTVGTSLGTTGTVNLDIAALNGTYQSITLTGDITFTTSNRAAGRTVTLRLIEPGTAARTLTLPAGWVFVGSSPPATLDNEVAILTVTFFGTNDTDAAAAIATDTSLTSQFAPLRLSLNPETASYTLVAGDEQKLVEMDVAAANTLTVPPASSVTWATGTQIHVVQAGAGQTTLTPGSGVTINGTPGLKTRAQWSTVTLIYRGSDVWLAVGDLAA